MSEPIVHTHKHPLEGSVYRTEHDTFGEIQVPATALWGAQVRFLYNILYMILYEYIYIYIPFIDTTIKRALLYWNIYRDYAI